MGTYLYKLEGGYPSIILLINSKNDDISSAAIEVVAATLQANPYSQERILLEKNLLDHVFSLFFLSGINEISQQKRLALLSFIRNLSSNNFVSSLLVSDLIVKNWQNVSSFFLGLPPKFVSRFMKTFLNIMLLDEKIPLADQLSELDSIDKTLFSILSDFPDRVDSLSFVLLLVSNSNKMKSLIKLSKFVFRPLIEQYIKEEQDKPSEEDKLQYLISTGIELNQLIS